MALPLVTASWVGCRLGAELKLLTGGFSSLPEWPPHVPSVLISTRLAGLGGVLGPGCRSYG